MCRIYDLSCREMEELYGIPYIQISFGIEDTAASQKIAAAMGDESTSS